MPISFPHISYNFLRNHIANPMDDFSTSFSPIRSNVLALTSLPVWFFILKNGFVISRKTFHANKIKKRNTLNISCHLSASFEQMHFISKKWFSFDSKEKAIRTSRMKWNVCCLSFVGHIHTSLHIGFSEKISHIQCRFSQPISTWCVRCFMLPHESF